MSATLSEQLTATNEWLCCKKNLAECASNTLYDFVPRNNKVNDIHLYMDNVPIERDYVTIFILDYWMMFS